MPQDHYHEDPLSMVSEKLKRLPESGESPWNALNAEMNSSSFDHDVAFSCAAGTAAHPIPFQSSVECFRRRWKSNSSPAGWIGCSA